MHLIIEKLNVPRFRSRIAFLDYDWTLVCPKDGRVFPKDVNDWMWLRPGVPDKIKSLYKAGFGIVIVTNQTKDWKKEQILSVMKTLDTPLTVCIAYDKADHKPSRALFDAVQSQSQQQRQSKQINLAKSFMCGDAMGRTNDHSDSDLKFAMAIGVECISPEKLFPVNTSSISKSKSKSKVSVKSILKPKSKRQEVVIMTGYPGSGKSTVVQAAFGTASEYFIARGDDLKTSAKMIKAALPHVQAKKSVVFDATNPSKKKRAEYVEFAKEHGLFVRCVHVTTSLEDSLARNNCRENPVPRIVYTIYKKNFETPSEDEGCEVIRL